jgi:hypothetical protein
MRATEIVNQSTDASGCTVPQNRKQGCRSWCCFPSLFVHSHPFSLAGRAGALRVRRDHDAASLPRIVCTFNFEIGPFHFLSSFYRLRAVQLLPPDHSDDCSMCVGVLFTSLTLDHDFDLE